MVLGCRTAPPAALGCIGVDGVILGWFWGGFGVFLGWFWGAVPLLLRHPAVDGDGGEVLLHQQLRQRNAALHRLHEDHHLRPSGVINEGSLALLGVISTPRGH